MSSYKGRPENPEVISQTFGFSGIFAFRWIYSFIQNQWHKILLSQSLFKWV